MASQTTPKWWLYYGDGGEETYWKPIQTQILTTTIETFIVTPGRTIDAKKKKKINRKPYIE